MEFMPCPQPVQLVDAVYYDPWLTQFARRPAKQSKSRQPQDDPGPFADLLFWGLMRRFMPKALSFLLPGLALLFARSCPFPPPWTKFAQLRHDGREPRGEASQLSSNCRVSGYAAATFVIPGPFPPDHTRGYDLFPGPFPACCAPRGFSKRRHQGLP
jgi:hypothetical protein